MWSPKPMLLSLVIAAVTALPLGAYLCPDCVARVSLCATLLVLVNEAATTGRQRGYNISGTVGQPVSCRRIATPRLYNPLHDHDNSQYPYRVKGRQLGRMPGDD